MLDHSCRPLFYRKLYGSFHNWHTWHSCSLVDAVVATLHCYQPRSESNVFTSMCQSFCPLRGVYPSMNWEVCIPAWTWSGGMRWPLMWSVCILLEYILVFFCLNWNVVGSGVIFGDSRSYMYLSSLTWATYKCVSLFWRIFLGTFRECRKVIMHKYLPQESPV